MTFKEFMFGWDTETTDHSDRRLLRLHRKEQWDLECVPLLCIHVDRADSCKRIFCLWLWGIEVGKLSWSLSTPRTLAPFTFEQDPESEER
jgi:hypothetical protein